MRSRWVGVCRLRVRCHQRGRGPPYPLSKNHARASLEEQLSGSSPVACGGPRFEHSTLNTGVLPGTSKHGRACPWATDKQKHATFAARLPLGFGQMSALQALDLQRSSLTQLPESFAEMASLQSADLQYNQLVALPLGFGRLRSLQKLHLQQNRLESLPEGFGNLASLQTLAAQHNRLAMLPEESAAQWVVGICGSGLSIAPEASHARDWRLKVRAGHEIR